MLHELLRSNDLHAAVAWLLQQDWGSEQRNAAIQRAFRNHDSQWSRQQLAERLAYFLLVLGDDAGGRLALRSSLPEEPDHKSVEICRLETDPHACFGDTEPLTAEAEREVHFEVVPGRWSDKPLAKEALQRIKPFVARLDGGRVPGLSFLPVTKDWRTCFTLFTFNPRNPNKTMGFEDTTTIPIRSPRALALRFDGVDEYEEGILVGAHENFGHWILNHLARLALVEAAPRLASVPLIVGENATAAQLECLELMGYGEARLVRLRKGRLARFRTLWAPTMLFCAFEDNPLWFPGMIDFLRRRLGVPDAARPGEARRRLYVTRRSARWRRVVNEEEALGVLSGFGFELVDPGTLTIRQQLDLAAGAEIVMGAAGAGLNLHLFAPRDACLIQLQQFAPMSMNISPAFTKRIGQRYFEVVGTPSPAPGEHPLNYSFTISSQQIEEALAATGLQQQCAQRPAKAVAPPQTPEDTPR